jgi:pimeloyl-ACP methyl ester carboxylesterase
LYAVGAVVLLVAVAGGYEAIREARDRSVRSMPGQLFDVDGHRLHLSCMGSGSPTVILEPGLGEPGVMMSGWIQPGVAAATRVCVYDRAGKGWSESARALQDGFAVADDLRTLLTNADIAGPYVLAGHSTGGVYAQIFAERYPDEVAGVVLLDSQSPNALAELPGWARFYRRFRTATKVFPVLAGLGLMRLSHRTTAGGLPSEARSAARAFWPTTRHNRSLRDEVAQLETTLAEAQGLKTLGDKPLVVVTAAKDAMNGWLPLQDEMAGLSTNSIHRVEQGATHTSLVEDQGDSAISIHAILDVVAAVRSGAPLGVAEELHRTRGGS